MYRSVSLDSLFEIQEIKDTVSEQFNSELVGSLRAIQVIDFSNYSSNCYFITT